MAVLPDRYVKEVMWAWLELGATGDLRSTNHVVRGGGGIIL